MRPLTEQAGAAAPSLAPTALGPCPSRVDALLAQARARYRRVDPLEAAKLWGAGGLLVDTRPAAQRAQFGEIPGALVIERNALEWRLDPTSPYRLACVEGRGQDVVLICQEGYASSLAAASLLDLGIEGATDVVGGFAAWRAAGLPTTES